MLFLTSGNEVDNEFDATIRSNICLRETRRRWHVFCLGRHDRVGEESPVRLLDRDVMDVILAMLADRELSDVLKWG